MAKLIYLNNAWKLNYFENIVLQKFGERKSEQRNYAVI